MGSHIDRTPIEDDVERNPFASSSPSVSSPELESVGGSEVQRNEENHKEIVARKSLYRTYEYLPKLSSPIPQAGRITRYFILQGGLMSYALALLTPSERVR